MAQRQERSGGRLALALLLAGVATLVELAAAAAARPSTAPALPPGFDYFGSRVELLTPERT